MNPAMEQAELSEERLLELVAAFSRARVAVVGDFFLDKYLEVDPALAEISVETGKTAHQVVEIRVSPGAAGTVVSNIVALGAGTLHAVGFTGDDGEGFELRRCLERAGCSTAHLHVAADRSTPTYLKPRDKGRATLSAEHSRYDTKNRRPTPSALTEKIVASVDLLLPEVDALLVMDQVDEADHGVVTGAVRQALSVWASRYPDVVFWADSRRRIDLYRDVIIKPNQFEAVGLSTALPDEGVPIDRLLEASRALRRRCRAPIVVTRGACGMIVSDPVWTVVPGVPASGEIDPTGAGDSASAGTALALCAGASLPEAAVIGNLVASITVEQIGTTGVARPDELPARLRRWHAGARRR